MEQSLTTGETTLYIFCVLFVGVLVVILTYWEGIKRDKRFNEKVYAEANSFEAEKLSQKMKNSRVEMGLKKPQSFKTKRKPQKTVKTKA